MKKLRVTVEGKIFEVLVEILDEGTPAAPSHNHVPVLSSAAAAPASLAPAAATAVAVAPAPKVASAGEPGTVPSPLAGKVVSVDVKVGDTVTEGAQVATLEAMKMNTYIYAPKAGRVDTVFVKAGDGVDEGSALLRIA